MISGGNGFGGPGMVPQITIVDAGMNPMEQMAAMAAAATAQNAASISPTKSSLREKGSKTPRDRSRSSVSSSSLHDHWCNADPALLVYSIIAQKTVRASGL